MTRTAKDKVVLPLYITLLFTSCIALLIGNGVSQWVNLLALQNSTKWIEHSWAVIADLGELRSLLVDAEAGQRGFLLTGDPTYLAPYDAAREQLQSRMERLTQLLSANQTQSAQFEEVRALTAKRLAIIEETIELRTKSGPEAAVALVQSPAGKIIMDRIRDLLGQIRNEEVRLLRSHGVNYQSDFWRTVWLGIAIGAFTGCVLALFYGLIRRNFRERIAAERALKNANEHLESSVRARTLQLSGLTRYLLRVSEQEKAVLASELHDELGANLTAINLDLASVANKLKDSQPLLAQRLARAQRTLHATVELKRRVIHNLRPSHLDNLGLAAAMRTHCEEFTARTGLPCITEVPDEIGQVDENWPIALFRVTQESLNNIIKHAQATSVRIRLGREEAGLRLQIIDDGVGLPEDATMRPLSHGVLGMRERVTQLGGVFDIRRGDNDRGTVVEAFLPFAT